MSAPLRSNSASASGPVAASDTSYPSLRSMYDKRVGVALLVLDDEHAGHDGL